MAKEHIKRVNHRDIHSLRKAAMRVTSRLPKRCRNALKIQPGIFVRIAPAYLVATNASAQSRPVVQTAQPACKRDSYSGQRCVDQLMLHSNRAAFLVSICKICESIHGIC
jgi:hypothetical protein